MTDHLGPPVVPPEECNAAPVDVAPAAPNGAGDDQSKRSAATMLVETAQKLFTFGVSTAGEPFAVPRTGPRITAMLRGGKTSLRAVLARAYFDQTGRAAPQQALADALLVIEGIAQSEEETELHIRVARHGGALWLDLGDLSGAAVRLTAQGWTVEESAPVFFRRTALNSPLPRPEPGGALSELWSWLNVSEDDRPEVAAWLVAALRPTIPHPVLSLAGEQGSGKTTAAKVLVSVLDPGPVPTRKPPRDADSWVTAAAGSWVVALDNLTNVSDWLSDSLCRAVTGEGDVRRKLYTDGDLAVISFRRCVILTGIDLGAINGDLADRLLPIELDVITGGARREEDEMWPAWREAHPRILGAVLDLAARVASLEMGGLSVEPMTKPRMADFARALAGVDEVLGTNGYQRYGEKQGALASESLTADAFFMAIADTVHDTFEGTSAELLDLIPAPERPPKGWPANARQVTQLLRRQAPPMRKAGWSVDDDRAANKRHAAVWTITPPRAEETARPEKARIRTSPPSPPAPPGEVGEVGEHEIQAISGRGDQGRCDLCAHVTLNRTPAGAWRHQTCDVAS